MTRLAVNTTYECDRCGFEEDTNKEYGTPEGWIEVWESQFDEDGTYQGLEFCSYRCVHKWAEDHAPKR